MKPTVLLPGLIIVAVICVGSTAGAKGRKKPQAECVAIENSYLRAECYAEVAVAQGNARICEDLAEAQPARSNCVIKVAMSKKNPDICNRLSGDHARTLCYRSVGDVTGDYSICDTLEKSGFRKACRPKGLKEGDSRNHGISD